MNTERLSVFAHNDIYTVLKQFPNATTLHITDCSHDNGNFTHYIEPKASYSVVRTGFIDCTTANGAYNTKYTILDVLYSITLAVDSMGATSASCKKELHGYHLSFKYNDKQRHIHIYPFAIDSVDQNGIVEFLSQIQVDAVFLKGLTVEMFKESNVKILNDIITSRDNKTIVVVNQKSIRPSIFGKNYRKNPDIHLCQSMSGQRSCVYGQISVCNIGKTKPNTHHTNQRS